MARMGETCSPCCPTSRPALPSTSGRCLLAPRALGDYISASTSGSSKRGSMAARVMTPARTTSAPSTPAQQHRPQQHTTTAPAQQQQHVAKAGPEQLLADVLQPVGADMETMRTNLMNIVGQRHPMLMAAAEQIFSAGKRSRVRACHLQASHGLHCAPLQLRPPALQLAACAAYSGCLGCRHAVLHVQLVLKPSCWRAHPRRWQAPEARHCVPRLLCHLSAIWAEVRCCCQPEPCSDQMPLQQSLNPRTPGVGFMHAAPSQSVTSAWQRSWR